VCFCFGLFCCSRKYYASFFRDCFRATTIFRFGRGGELFFLTLPVFLAKWRFFAGGLAILPDDAGIRFGAVPPVVIRGRGLSLTIVF